MSTPDLLRVTEPFAIDAGEVEIEIDEYVPLTMRSSKHALGAGYVRLGNYKTTLVELGVDPRTQVLRGVTVTSISKLSLWPSFDVVARLDGLPTLSTTFEGGEVVNLPRDFEVAVRECEFVVFWAPLTSCRGYTVGQTTFLVAGDRLAGVHVADLTETQVELIKSLVGK